MANEYDDLMREEVPAPNTEPSYDDIGKVLSVQNSRAVQASMFTAKDRDPVKAAESVNLSREYNMPTDMVERKFDEVKKTKILHNDYDRIVTETPGLGRWLETPDKAAVGQNELESLGAIDKGTREIVRKTGLRQAVETGLVGLESSAYALGGLMGMTSLDEAAELMANANKRQQELAQAKPTFAKEFEQTMQKEMGDVNKSLDSMFDAWHETKNKDITAIFKTFKEGALTVGETIDMIATAVSKPRGLAYMTAESAAFSLPALVGAGAGAAAGTAVTPGVGTAIGLASGTFAGSVLTETGAWMNQALQDRGYDTTNAESIRQAFSDKSLLKEMRDEAVRKGVTTAAVDALFSAFAGKIATGPAKSVAGRAARVAGDTGLQMVGEAVSEGAGQAAATGKVDVGGAILEGIASLGQSAAETTIGATATAGKEIAGKAQDAYRKRYSPNPIRATQEVAIDTTNALEAMQAAETLQQIQVAVEGAENTRKVPGYIKDLVDASTESDVVQSVYFQSDDFDDYFNRKGLSPSKAAYDISEEVGKNYDSSKENGTPIEVPLGEYVEKIAPNKETFDEMLEIVRTKPDGMTLAEAQEHVKNLQQTMNDLADEAIAGEQAQQKQVNEADQKALNEYSTGLQSQLMETGMSQNDARAVSQLESQRLQNRASIRGQAISDVIAERPLTISLQEGMGREDALNQSSSKNKMLGSAGSKEQLNQLVNKYFYSSNISFVDNGDGTFSAHNSKGKIDGFVITEKKGRWRFEMKPLEQGSSKGPRGQFRATDSRAFVELFKGRKNPSTIIHEFGHLWRFQVQDDLNYVQGLEAKSEGQAQFTKDVDSILEYLEAKDIANLTVDQEEKFARAIELYLLEGKAPSANLQSAFSRIKVWMLSVYRSVKNFFKQNNVDLNDNMREVFDRLFVAETEVTESQIEMNYEAPFQDARAAGMSEAQATRYQEAREKSRAAAEQILSEKLIADYKKQEQKVYKERRTKVKAEVTEQVNNTRVYKALDNIKTGELEGGGSMKLDRQALVDMYDENFVKNRLKNMRIYTREGGLNPVVAASLFGYESADQMITEMVNAPSKDSTINAITDQRMREEYPDLMYQPDLEAEAMKAVHNEKQSQVYRLELEFFLDQEKTSTKDVVRAITRKIPSTKAVKAEAQRVIGEKKVNDVKPYIYRRAEANYNREAGIEFAKGNFDAAFEAKKKALLNYEMFNVAVEAIEQFRKDKEFFKNFRKTDEKLSATRDINFIEAGRAILSSYGLYRNDGSKPSDFLNDMKKYDPQAYETVASIMDNIANKGNDNWKTLTYNNYKDMSDGVKALWDLSKEARNIEINGKKMDIEEAAKDLLSGFSEHQKKIDKKEFIQKAGPLDKAKLKFLGFRASLTRVEHWTNMMDLGDKINGPFRKYIYQPIVDGTTQYRLKKFDTLKKLLGILEPLRNDMANESTIIATELMSPVGSMDGVARPYKFSFNELLGMVLHTGNDSNKRKLLLGRGWGTLDQDGNLVTTNFDKFMNRMFAEGVIKKEHMDAIQQIWDLMEEMKPAAQRAHKQMYGYYFNEITANEVVTPFGTYRGGYVPAKADPMVVLDAEKRALVEILEKEQGNFAFPATTGRGSTFSRVENYNAPLIMDLRMITGHVDWAMRFSHIEPKIKQVSRLLNNKDVFAELNAFDPQALKEMLIPFTKRAASQKLTEINDIADKTVGRVLNYVRTNTGAGLMFFNIGNLMEQIFSSVPQAMTQVKGKYVMNAMMDYTTSSKKMTEFVNDKSDFMKTRSKRSIHLVNEQLDALLSDPSKFEQLQDFAKNNAYILQAGAQNVMDIFIWKSAYEQAVGDQGASEDQAVKYADSIIRETQSSFNPEDAAAIEAGGPMRRAFMMFYSYFNTMGNLVATQITAIQKDLGFKKGAGRMFWIYMMGVAMPSFISQMVKKALAGKFDEDDDDEYLDDLFGTFFMGQFQTITATVPWAGSLINNALNQFNDKPYDDRLSLSPVVSMLESTARTPMHAYNLLSEEGRVNERQALRDFLTLISVTTGLPAMPLARPINYLRDVSQGNANPTGPIDFTRGLISGKPGE